MNRQEYLNIVFLGGNFKRILVLLQLKQEKREISVFIFVFCMQDRVYKFILSSFGRQALIIYWFILLTRHFLIKRIYRQYTLLAY